MESAALELIEQQIFEIERHMEPHAMADRFNALIKALGGTREASAGDDVGTYAYYVTLLAIRNISDI